MRALSALVATLVVTLLGLTTAVPTGAIVSAAAVDKPRHVMRDLQAGPVAAQPGVYYVQGRVVTAKGERVYLQKRTRAKPRWRGVASAVARHDSGRFRITFRAGCRSEWRLVVRETRRYARTKWYLGRVVC